MPLDNEFMPGAFKKNVSRLKFGFCFLVAFKFGDNLRNQNLKRHNSRRNEYFKFGQVRNVNEIM